MKTKESLKQVMALGVCTVALATAVPAITPVEAYAVSYSYEFTTPKYTERDILVDLVYADSIQDNGLIDGRNDVSVQFDQSPVIINDRTFVPMRAVFEALGCQVGWNEDTKTVTVSKDGIEVTMVIGNSTMQVNKNGQVSSVALDAAPVIINGRTLIPLRAPAEAFGCYVYWSDGIIYIGANEAGITAVSGWQAQAQRIQEEQRRQEEEKQRQQEERAAVLDKAREKMLELDKQYKANGVNFTAEEYAQEVLKCMNIAREIVGSDPYVMNSDLQAGAKIRAQECATRWEHIRPNGTDSDTAIPNKRNYYGTMEILAKRIPGTDSPADFIYGWMNSAHIIAITDKESTITGIGVYKSGDQVYCAAFMTRPKK